MRKNTVIAQLIVFGVLSVVILTYAVFGLLGVNLTNKPYKLVVELHTGGGIFPAAEVAYRGVEVGTVKSVDLQTNGVRLTLSIEHGTKIPTDAVAHIYDLSAVGEQYVDLVPSGKVTTYLTPGSVIPAERTSTPLQTATVLYDLERFVDSINAKDIQILGREGSAAFAGTGPELKSILADAQSIVAQLSATQAQTVDLLQNAATLLHGAAAHSSAFDTFSTSLRDLTTTLASSTPTTNKLLQDSATTTLLLNDIIQQNGNALGVLLANLATLSDIQVARVPGLQSLLVAVPEFGRLAPAIISGDTLQGVLNVDESQPLCPSGLPMTSPLSGKRSALVNANCDSPTLARGAINAPRPGGAQTQAQAATPFTATNSPDGSTSVGSYDATSGLVATPSGSAVRLGTNGGQSELFGPNSWEALLLAVTG
jgi:phospholipid/cholesterol/gamma-HCH transport system substrate-binding protein